ncbi:MAG: nitroreductase family protein [Dehalococcoidales bacterium]|nr:nitroreductase family protein [Dehalococcoidales bacterium]
MAIVEINKETCTKCNACAIICGANLIIPRENDYPRFFPNGDEFCMRCGHCVGICPTGSLTHKEFPLENCPPIDKTLEPSFKQVAQLIKSRRSIREYQDKPVPREEIEKIIDVARYAPTGHNMQEVQWLVIDDKEKLKEMTAIGVDWFRSMAEGDAPWAVEMKGVVKMHELGINIFLRNAPVVVCTIAEMNSPIAAIDGVIAASYFDLAAKAAGLGCCWNGFFQMAAQSFPAMVKAVALPKGMRIYGAMMVGYPVFKYQRIPPRKEARITYYS